MQTEIIERIFAERDSTITRDLKLNLKKLLGDSSIGPSDAALTLVALGHSLGSPVLETLGRDLLRESEFTSEIVEEAAETAAIVGMLNIYYRFRHFVDHSETATDEGYGPAKLRMQSLGNPKMGKHRFEMLAFALSVLNGCEKCTVAHEQALLQLGTEKEKLHDLARLASIAYGVNRLLA